MDGKTFEVCVVHTSREVLSTSIVSELIFRFVWFFFMFCSCYFCRNHFSNCLVLLFLLFLSVQHTGFMLFSLMLLLLFFQNGYNSVFSTFFVVFFVVHSYVVSGCLHCMLCSLAYSTVLLCCMHVFGFVSVYVCVFLVFLCLSILQKDLHGSFHLLTELTFS